MTERIALVTGASRGIGRAIGRQLAADGLTVIINYRQNEAAAEELAPKGVTVNAVSPGLILTDGTEAMDREKIISQTPFGRRAAHGLLGLVAGGCLLSRVGWFTFWPQSMLAISSLDKVRFAAPIFIGDTIRLEAEIIEKRAMSPERGVITTRMRIKNQRDEAAITFRLGLVAGRRPPESPGTC